MERSLDVVPAADRSAEPEGFMVVADDGVRVHFLDWGGTPDLAPTTGVLLVHGLSQTAWLWTAVARRVRSRLHTVALDLRGHGLSDAPTEDPARSYDLAALAGDAIAVAEGSSLLGGADHRVVLVGHGFGAIVAVRAAAVLGAACAGLLLVDGGFEDLEQATGVDVDEFLRELDEPPEVLASMTAFLADRAAFDPDSWDADEERAVRATVVETHAGRVVPATRPHALEASVRAMFAYDPTAELSRVEAPVHALVAGDDGNGPRARVAEAVSGDRQRAGRGPITITPLPGIGHNLARYRPAVVAAAILSFAAPPGR